MSNAHSKHPRFFRLAVLCLTISLLLTGTCYGYEMKIAEPAEFASPQTSQSAASGVDTAAYKSGDLSVSAPTQRDLAIARSYATQFTYSQIYDAVPSVTSPYAAGSLSAAYLQTGAAYLGYIRYAAGLPDPVLNAEWSMAAQHGAVVMAANDLLSHYPAQPTDMPDDFYAIGSDATSSSNISMRYGYGNINYLIASLTGCMSDNSSSNMQTLGHRRWLLNPIQTMQVGFGEATSTGGSKYIATKIYDRSGGNLYGEKVDYRYVAWPASGNFPSELFGVADPWSVTLNPAYYSTPQADKITVTITRAADGTVWSLDQKDHADTPQNTAAYFSVNTGGYGVSNCIIFHPGKNNLGVSQFSGRYTVEIAGLTDRQGNETALSYDVDFFDVTAVTLPDYTVSVTCSAGGRASASASQVPAGHNVSLTVSPDTGYEIAAVLINGETQPPAGSYTLEKITCDTEISVLFQRSSTGYLTDGTFYYASDGESLTLMGLVDPQMAGTLTLPESYLGIPVTAIGENALSDLTHVTGFAAAEGNPYFMCLDGVLFAGKDGVPVTLLRYPPAAPSTVYVIPSSVTGLAAGSFAQAENLTHVFSAAGNLEAASDAFAGCTLNMYCRASTRLYAQLRSGSLSGQATPFDLAAQGTLIYLKDTADDQVLAVNLAASDMKATLMIAEYNSGRMLRCRMQPFSVAANSIGRIRIDAPGNQCTLLKLFCLDAATFQPKSTAVPVPVG